MNEGYSTKKSLKNNYWSLDSLTEMVNEISDIEDDVFGSIDNLNLSPSQDTMNKIFAYL